MGYTKVITSRVDEELFEALEEYARAEHNGSMSLAVKELLRASLLERGSSLGALGAAGSKDRGYVNGLRRGLHEARVAIREAMDDLWPK